MFFFYCSTGIQVGGKTFGDFETLEKAFLANEVTAEALKQCIYEHLNPKMEVVRQEFEDPERKRLIELAYPSDEATNAAKHATGASFLMCITSYFPFNSSFCCRTRGGYSSSRAR